MIYHGIYGDSHSEVSLSLYILGYILYRNAKNASEIPWWINVIFCGGLLYIIYWIAKSEWNHRKPRHVKIKKD